MSSLTPVQWYEPVYPMLQSEYVAGVETMLKWPSVHKWTPFVQALQNCSSWTRLHQKAEVTKSDTTARSIMRGMEFTAFGAAEQFKQYLERARAFLHPVEAKIPDKDSHAEIKMEAAVVIESIESKAAAPILRSASEAALMSQAYQAQVNGMYSQWMSMLAKKQVFFLTHRTFLLV